VQPLSSLPAPCNWQDGEGEARPGQRRSKPAIHGGEIPAGAFLGKSIPEAAELYLSIVNIMIEMCGVCGHVGYNAGCPTCVIFEGWWLNVDKHEGTHVSDVLEWEAFRSRSAVEN
jgi:hypothetical protein